MCMGVCMGVKWWGWGVLSPQGQKGSEVSLCSPCPFMGGSDGVTLWAEMRLAVSCRQIFPLLEREQTKNGLVKDFVRMVWKHAGPYVCTHLPESEHSLPGTCSCCSVCIQGHTEQRGGTQPPPQHLAHGHLIKACF